MGKLKNILYRLRGEYTTEQLLKMGMKVGKNFGRLNGVILDPSHCWLIEIGDNVTMAPRVHILCHDASTKQFMNYTKIGRVTIGDNVFIGAESVVLPGVTIGNNVIVGANSTVTHDIPDNTVVAGTPAKLICTLDDYLNKEKERMKSAPCYGEDYTLRKDVSMEKRMKQKEELKGKIGYID
ncbi:acyltransferase [Catenibacterium mitsuokai]|uniref:acyltransferase n=1 Tax=Catenibacterium mitsuokai TaxID=100886 RepID=UPI003D094CF4